MASIQKRGKTYQYVVSRMTDGKPDPIRKGGFRTKKEAQLAGNEIEAQLAKGTLPQLKPVLFDQYFEKWVNLYKTNISKSTRLHYEYTLKAIKDHFSSRPLQEIKRHEYQEFINQFGSTRSKETVEKVNGHIRACVKDAVEEQIIQHDFTRKANIIYTILPKETEEKYINYKDSVKLSKELMLKIDEDGSIGYYGILIAFATGIRYEELVGLTFNSFDFINNTIRIDKVWGYNKKMERGFGPTKNGKPRTITINSETMSKLKTFVSNAPPNKNNLVFYSRKSIYQVMCHNYFTNLLKNLQHELGIEPIITAHGLRHTHGSILLYKGLSILYISKRLGHKDIQTTLRTYAHLIDESREEEEIKTRQVLDDLLV